MDRRKPWAGPIVLVVLTLLGATLACGQGDRATSAVVVVTSAPIVVTQPPAQPQPAAPGLPVIDYFTSESSGRAGCYYLHWDLHDATAATLNGQGVTAPASTEVCPEATADYVLRAENAAGHTEQTITIQVGGEPPPPPPDNPPQAQTVTLQSLPAEDGYVRGMDAGESMEINGNVTVGDGKQNNQQQAFFSFDISGIPQGADIQQAVLDFSNHTVVGDPFATLGQLAYYTVEYGSLGVEDFVKGSPLPEGATLFDGQPGTLDVRALVQWLVNAGSARFQCRLQFQGTSNSNNQADGLSFPEGGPALTVTYQ